MLPRGLDPHQSCGRHHLLDPLLEGADAMLLMLQGGAAVVSTGSADTGWTCVSFATNAGFAVPEA